MAHINNYHCYCSRIMHTGQSVWQFRQWIMCIVAATIVLLTVLLLSYFWSTIMYNFNLYHSKSLPYSESFMGREREMEEMMKFVNLRNHSVRIVNIIGSPGFGKSTLAINVGHEVVRNGDIVHYINMADFPSKAEIKPILCEKIFDSARIVAKNTSFEALLRWARRQFSNSLLILDNCDDVIHSQKAEFQDAVKRLVEQSMSIKIVITSREIVPFVQSYYEWFKVDELSAANAQTLLESKVAPRVSLTQDEKEKVAKLTGNVPLALQIIGSLLRLPGSPMPSTVISELTVEPMVVLSPPNFPANEQIFNTINLSYKYLSKELQEVGRQLTVFPGSFTSLAAVDILCAYTGKILNCPPVYTSLRNLILSSLLEYNQRTDRFQYHRLIRDYFLHVQNKEYPNEAEKILPSFHVHYAKELMSMSKKIKSDYELTLACIDSERHNIQYLLELMPSLPTKDFLLAVMALSEAIHVGLMSLRFSKTDLCTILNTSLTRLDVVVSSNHFNEEQNLIPSYSKEAILAQYIIMIDQVAVCMEDSHDAIQVYSDRANIIKRRSLDIDPIQYADFFTVLSNYYSAQHGYERQVIMCHRAIIERTNAHLDTCNSYECNYYDIGEAYYNMHEYRKAAEFLERALVKKHFGWSFAIDDLEHLKVLTKLYYTYNNLREYDKTDSILLDISALRSKVLETPSEKLFSYSATVQVVIGLYKKLGFVRDAVLLEKKLLCSVKDVGVKAVHKPWALSFGLSLQVDREKKVPLDVAYNVANRLYENDNYLKTIEMATYFIDILKNSTDYRNELIIFHVLLGKAMFSVGNYSEGMDEMELALRIILEQPSSNEQMKTTACWYLIPRVRYIETCYNISQVPLKVVHYISSFVLYIVFSPYPFTLPTFVYDNLHLRPASAESSSTAASHSSELTATMQDFGVLSTTVTSHSSELTATMQDFGVLSTTVTSHSSELTATMQDFGVLSTKVTVDGVWQFASSIVEDHLLTVQYSVTEIFTASFNNIILTMIYHFVYVSIWIIIVWLKLIFIFSKSYNSSELICYYCVSIPILLLYTLRYPEQGPSLKLLLRAVRDPRFIILYNTQLE